MLVLTRRLNETIVIDDNITVTVVEVRGNRVKLGIVAPAEVQVRRAELENWAGRKEPAGNGT